MSWFRARRRAGDERGAVLVFTALSMVLLIGSTALAVDIGQQVNSNRDLQAAADAIALDSARSLNGASVGVLGAPTGAVTLAATQSAARNNIPFTSIQVHLGTKTVGTPFVHLTAAGAIPNAVRIIANETVDFSFRPGTTNTSRRAVATQQALAGFSLGSYLLSTSDEEDTVLNGIFGDAFSAQVLSYSGLVSSNITLEAIGLAFPLGVLTPNELLTTDISLANYLIASATVLRNQGNTVAANILDAFRLSMTSNSTVNLGDIIEAEYGGATAAATANLNVLQMLTAMAFIADGTHAINIPAAQLAIPGIGGVTLNIEVLEPLKFYFGPAGGTPISTAQVRMTVTPHLAISTSATVNGCSLTGTLGALLSLNISQLLQCTLGGFIGRIISLDLNADVPISLEAAGAEAQLTAINCAAPQSITVGLEAQPLTLTSNLDLNFTGTLLGNSLGTVLRVRGTAGATAHSTATSQNFLYPSQFFVPRSLGSTPLGLGNLSNFTATNVTLLNTNLTPVLSALTAPILALVNSTLGALDTNLLSPLTRRLGLNIGGADLTALALSCNGVQLAE